MSGKSLETANFGSVVVTPSQARAAAVHIADRIAAQHPHPLDDDMPRLAGHTLAQNPAVADDLRNLLDAIGLLATAARPRARE